MNRRDFIALCAATPILPRVTRPRCDLAEAIRFERKGILNDQIALTQDMLDQAEDACDVGGERGPFLFIVDGELRMTE